MASLRAEDIKILEQTRSRLLQLTQSLNSLKTSIYTSTNPSSPLPPWDSIQAQTSILSKNLESIVGLLARESDTLGRIVVYPQTNYPGRTQEGLLTVLLRKKVEVGVEGWMDEGRAVASGGGGKADSGSGGGMGDVKEVWDWAAVEVQGMIARAAGRIMRDGYTAEERENGKEHVRTGLKGKVEAFDDSDADSEGEDDEDEDEEMEDAGGVDKGARVQGARSLDDMVMFGTSGRTAA